ncbi:Cyclic di-GMP phosphodiesterase PdeR [Zhongshania aliphaticivorans]|nr:Cyclic di-GMP phosphodiesterase PdeR [Zhongshania aliphaticivorans]
MGARGYYTYTQISSHNHEAVDKYLLHLEQTFHSFINHSNNELFRLANSPTILNDLDSNQISPKSLSPALPNIDSVAYFSRDGHQLALAGKTNSASTLPPPLEGISNSAPIAVLNCDSTCYQRAYIPVQNSHQQTYIVNLNRSAEYLIEGFSEIAGVDIAIISLASPETAPLILLSSDSDKIQHLAVNIDSSANIRKSFFDKSKAYSTRIFPLNSNVENHHYVAIVIDHAMIYEQDFQSVKDIFLTWLITLSIIMGLITLILKPSLNRLSELTKVLPLLPHGQFDDARQSLKKLDSNPRWNDEIDVLVTTLGKMIDSLDSMDQIVNDHKNELAQKIEALTEAKVFNETLLDSSPLAILIHDIDGKISNINKLGRQLTGLTEQSPPSANINTWIKDGRQNISLSTSLRPLLNREGNKTQGETTFYTADGRKLDFLWTHSSLLVGGELKILSLGIDVTERREATESLRWLGQHDRVTGLLNRSSFTEDANNYISKNQTRSLIELLMLDIDDFATFNDRRGFDTGDKLLNDFAAHLYKSLPPDTLISRTGSGEFCALIHHDKTSQSSTKDLCLDHLTRFAFRLGDDEEEVCLSGVVDSYHEGLSGIDELISNTTSTMLRVKNKLRGHLFYASDDDAESSRSSRHQKYQMKEQLLSALNENRLVLFYQPILNLSSNRISHCECLVRMLDDEGQFIAPAKFLGIASESGLLPKLDYSVIEKAMRQQSLWEESGITTSLSINVTAPTLEQADFKQRIEELIHLTGANPHRLIFEIVETDAISNLGVTHDLLHHFKAIGAKIAFDDFGIGFTSFEYVRELPVDYIKIDQSFIRFIHEREQDRVLVKSMVEMSHSLGKKVIVEGVENRAALDIVRDIGVEYVQGYYICRPMPISALDLSLHLRK